MSEWISVETDPKTFFPLWVKRAGQKRVVIGYNHGPYAWYVIRWDAGTLRSECVEDITHWARIDLPDPPKETRPDCRHYREHPSYADIGAACVAKKDGKFHVCDPGAGWCEYGAQEDSIDALQREVERIKALGRQCYEQFTMHRHDINGRSTDKPSWCYPGSGK